MTLTAMGVKALKPREKPYKVFDEQGLYILVNPNGSLLWRFKYRFRGRENHLALGAYPDISLKNAREKRQEARTLLGNDIDPAEKRRAEKQAGADTFEYVAREWLTTQRQKLKQKTWQVALRRFEMWVFPHIGREAIGDIEPPDILRLLRRLEAKDSIDSAHRVRGRISQVFRYAIATGRADRDPTADLRGALKPVVSMSRAALTEPKQVGGLLRAIDGYMGHPPTINGLKLLALTFVRPGELRLAEWREIDLKEKIWRVPAERMKMGREHLVPLSTQAVGVFNEQLKFARGPLVFESARPGRPISDNTFNAALRTMGYTKDMMTAHGFRALASTLLHEQGWPPEVIELQLAHAQRNQVAAAYNRSARLKERTDMMQAWADYLDGLRDGGAVVPLKRKANADHDG